MTAVPILPADTRSAREAHRSSGRRSDRGRSDAGRGDFAAAAAAADTDVTHGLSRRSTPSERGRAGAAEWRRERDHRDERRAESLGEEHALAAGSPARPVPPAAPRPQDERPAVAADPDEEVAAATPTVPTVADGGTGPGGGSAVAGQRATPTATSEPATAEVAAAPPAPVQPSGSGGSDPADPAGADLDGGEIGSTTIEPARTPPAFVVLHGDRRPDGQASSDHGASSGPGADVTVEPVPSTAGQPRTGLADADEQHRGDPTSTGVPEAVPAPDAGAGPASTIPSGSAGSTAPAVPGVATHTGPSMRPGDVEASAVGALGGRVADATPEVPAWRQVAAALRTVRDADNRPQAVSLELAPASLGRVRIEATLRDGVLDVKLRTETDNALDVLRAGMAELRRDVEAAGVKSGRLEVRALERSSGDHTGDALHERQPGSPGLYADVEPGAGGERGSGRWRSGGDGTSPGLAGTGPLPLPAAVAAGSAATRGLSHHRLDLRL